MKLVRAISVVFLLSLFAAVAQANPIDPGIDLGGGSPTPQSLTFSGQGFTVSLTNGTGSISILNQILPAMTLPGIIVNVTTPFSGMLGCTQSAPTFYVNATPGATSCTFSGLDSTHTGIPFSPIITTTDDFVLSFSSFTGSTIPSLNFTITVVPEPGTMLLLGTGVAAVVARRKWRKGARPDA